MKIEYTYQQPTDRPIETAEFKSSVDNDQCVVSCINIDRAGIGKTSVAIKVSNIARTLLLSKSDFADFTALINRINKQINE